MVDILLPPWLGQARVHFRYMDNTGVSRSPYNGAPKTATLGGDRLSASLEFTPQGGGSTQMERAALISFLARLRGKQNRAYLFDAGNRLRGSFPATELISNNTFASGTTGWTSNNYTLSVSSRVMRSMLASRPSSGSAILRSGAVSTVQYAPHVARIFIDRNTRNTEQHAVVIRDGGTLVATSVNSTSIGMLSVAYAGAGTSHTIDLRSNGEAGAVAGQFVDVSYVSYSRCALVDNGPNLLLQSDEFDATWTATRSSVDDQATAAPDGTSTADSIIEDATASNTHYVSQVVTVSASTNLDFAYTVALRAGTRTWARLMLFETTGSTNAAAYFNLSTGAVGTINAGANWANARAFVVSMGDGWYACTVVARKTNAATSLNARILLATGDNGDSYTGDGSSNIYAWRATLAQSSVPTRLVQTTTTATSGASQTGSALQIKGLPASTNGLLLPNDQFEVITSRGSELKIVTAALNSDAGGLGYLQFEPPLRGTPAENAPIIVLNPMGYFLFAGDFPEWSTDPGIITTASAEFEEI